MERHADNAGLALLATVFGMLTAQHWVTQFATSIVTMLASLIAAHFVKRELQRRWPTKRQELEDTE